MERDMERQVFVMFAIARSGILKVKAMLTKLWPNHGTGHGDDMIVPRSPYEPKYIRDHPEEGATRTAQMTDRDRSVERQPEQGRMKSVSSSSVSSSVVETRMADVIRLQDRQQRGSRRADPSARQDATILLFTGIRYERLTEPALLSPPDSAPAGSANQKH
jgi:hypothetical protein